MTVRQLIKLLEETQASFSSTPYEVVIRVKGGRKEYNKLTRISTDTGICGTYVTLQLEEDDIENRIHWSERKDEE